jgi:ATP-dependent DNA helicase RecG
MNAACQAQGLPEPDFPEGSGGVKVVFHTDPLTHERLYELGLNGRQVQAVLYIKMYGSIGNKEYQQLSRAF